MTPAPSELRVVNATKYPCPSDCGENETSAWDKNSTKNEDRRRRRSKFISRASWASVGFGFFGCACVARTAEGVVGMAETEVEPEIEWEEAFDFGLGLGLKVPIRSEEDEFG